MAFSFHDPGRGRPHPSNLVLIPPSSSRSTPRPEVLPRYLGLALVVLALFTLAGWALRQTGLLQLVPGMRVMVISTAVAFLICGLALRAAVGGTAQRALALAVTLLGAIHCLGMLLLPPGLSVLPQAWYDWIDDGNPHPGSMSLLPSLGFISAGIALLLIRTDAGRHARRVHGVLVHLISLLGFVALLGHAVHYRLLYKQHALSLMAPTTALGFILLGLGLLFVGRQAFRKPTRQRDDDRRIATVGAWIMAAVAVAAALPGYLLLQRYSANTLSRSLMLTLDDSIGLLAGSLESRRAKAALIINRPAMIELVSTWNRAPDATIDSRLRAELRAFAAYGFSGIELHAADGRSLLEGRIEQGQRPSLQFGGDGDFELRWGEPVLLRYHGELFDGSTRLGEVIADQPLPRLGHGIGDAGLHVSRTRLLLCRQNLAMLQCLSDQHPQAPMSLPRDALPRFLDAALGGERGVMTAPDHRDRLVVAAYRPVPELGLVAVLSADVDELYLPLTRTFYVSLFGLVLLAVGGGWVLQRQIEPMTRRLVQAEARASANAHELEGSQAVLSSLYNHAPLGILVLDVNGVIVRANECAAQIFAYPVGTMVGMIVDLLIPPDYRTAYRLRRARYFTTLPGRLARAPRQISGRKRNGAVVPLDLLLSAIQVGERRLLVVMVSDISQRKRAEQSLRESEQRFRSIIEHAPIGMALISPSGRWLELNAALSALTGYSADDLRKLTFHDLMHPDDYEDDAHQHERLLAREIGSYQADRRYRRRDGRYVWVVVAVSLVRDAGGQPLHFIVQFKDNEERRRAEEQLHSALALQSAIVTSAHAAIIATDSAGTIVSFNTAAQRMLGYAEDEVIGMMNPLRLHDPQEVEIRARELSHQQSRLILPSFEALIAPVRFSGADQREWSYVRKDGTKFPVLLSTTALRDDSGTITGFLGVATDISDRKRQEIQIRAALHEKETLLREVYHRVKNNLQVVSSLLNLQFRSAPPGPAQAAVKEAAERVRTMALVHEKLYRSPTLSAIALDDYLGDLVTRVAASADAGRRHIEVECRCVELEIGLDTAVPLGLIVNELLSNAFKHAFPEGRGGHIAIDVEADEQQVTLSVTDDGLGLSADAGRHPSASLGLVLVRSLSSQLDGHFVLESQSGTLARLILPRARCIDPAAPRLQSEHEPR